MPFNASPLVPGDLYDAAAKLAGRADLTLASLADPRARKDMLAKLWREITELGWHAVTIPEAAGGAGGDLQELASLAEGFARSALPLPVASACGLVPQLLIAAGSGGSKLLAGVASGDVRAVAAIDAFISQNTDAMKGHLKAGGKLRLEGRSLGSDCPPDATHFLIACPVDGVAALIVLARDEAAVSVRYHERMDRRPTIDLELTGQDLPASVIIARGSEVHDAVNRAVATGALLAAVEAIGAMGALLEQTIVYLSKRIQFGAPLSSFQVLRHRVAELYASYEQSRAMVMLVLGQSANAEWPSRELAMTKMRLGSAARQFAKATIQLHGGMGISEEMPASRLAKRLLMVDFEFGNSISYESKLLSAER